MTNIDNQIKDALQSETDHLDINFDKQQSGFNRIAELFNGQMKYFNIFAYIILLAFTVAIVFSAIEFFKQDTTRGQILFATLFISAWTAGTAVKIWLWQAINRNSVLREIKRLEYRICELIEKH